MDEFQFNTYQQLKKKEKNYPLLKEKANEVKIIFKTL